VFLTLAALLVTDRQARFWRGLRPLVGVPLLLLIAAPWYLAIILADDTFLREAGGRDFLGKLLAAQEQHGAPPGAYAVILIVAFAPASLFVWQALRWSWTWRREAAVRFCLCWILPFWIVLELTPTKLPHYILPTFPALALLIALAVQAAEAGEFRWLQHRASRTLYIVGLLLIGGFAVVAFGNLTHMDGAPALALSPDFALPLDIAQATAGLESESEGRLVKVNGHWHAAPDGPGRLQVESLEY
jgi:4-amino-4-deoxy-L-arabinose transferase-like glycosyltransferase